LDRVPAFLSFFEIKKILKYLTDRLDSAVAYMDMDMAYGDMAYVKENCS
jgi:hypothetical protein